MDRYFPVRNFEYSGIPHKVVLWRFPFDEKLWFEFPEICSDEWNLTAFLEFRGKITALWDITKFLKIYYRKCPFHLTFLPKFSFWMVFGDSAISRFSENFVWKCLCLFRICGTFLGLSTERALKPEFARSERKTRRALSSLQCRRILASDRVHFDQASAILDSNSEGALGETRWCPMEKVLVE